MVWNLLHLSGFACSSEGFGTYPARRGVAADSSPYSFCKQFMRRSRKCASEFLVGLCNPIVSCNTYEKLCNGYLGGKDRSARLTGIPNMDS